MTPLAIQRWEHIATSGDFGMLDELLAEDVVFESPVLHAPQVGRAITKAYLMGAVRVLRNPAFRFVGSWFGEQSAVLELEAQIDGVSINAVDIIRWNSEERIKHFKVMVRPLKAMNVLQRAMGVQLAASDPKATAAARTG